MNSYNGFSPYLRQKSWEWQKKQYAAGRPEKKKCDLCGQTKGLIESHTEDYSEPFGDHIDQFGVCYPCHMMIHCRGKNPKAFREYGMMLASGRRYVALFFTRQHSNWARFCDTFLANGGIRAETEAMTEPRAITFREMFEYAPGGPRAKVHPVVPVQDALL